MVEKQILKLFLNKKYFNKYKGTLSRSVFEGMVGSLYDTIQKAHSKYDSDISIDELYSLHTSVYNPALTRAMKISVSELVEDIRTIDVPNEKIADDIIKVMQDRNVAQKIAVEATEIFNGRPADFSVISKIIEHHEQDKPVEQIDSVTDNIGELINQLNVTTKWKFNLAELKNNIGGVGDGNFELCRLCTAHC